MPRKVPRKTLALLVVSMLLLPGLAAAMPAGDGGGAPAAEGDDDATPAPVGYGEGMEPAAIPVDIYEDRFTPVLPWPTNRTWYDMLWISDYGLMVGSGGSLLRFNASGIEWIHTGTEESLYDIAYSWPRALVVGNHSTLFIWDVDAEDLTRVEVSYDQRFLGAAWAEGGSDAVIVGDGGFIGIFNGTSVEPLTTGLIDFIYRVEWIPGGDHAIAVGDNGLVVKVNTTEVINSTRLDFDWGLWRLSWDHSGSHAIIVGKDYSYVPPRSLVVRYNATGTFDSIPVPGTALSGLRSVTFGGGSAPDADRALIAGENSTVLIWNGSGLVDMQAPEDRTFRACLWYDGPADRFYVAGNRGIILLHEGGGWTNLSFDPRENLYSIDWRPQGDYGLAVGAGGHIFKVSLQGGSEVTSPVTNDLFDVSWASDGSFALICGGGGRVLRYNHGDAEATSIREGLGTLRGISVKPDSFEALAVGDGGHVWHWQGGVWTDKKMLGDGRNLWDVAWRPDGAFAIIVGVSGAVLNFTGTGLADNFFPQPDTFAPFFSVAWSKGGKYAMIVGARDATKDHDNIWVYDNRNVGPVGSDTGEAFYGCAFTADNEVGVAFATPDVVVKFSTRTFEGKRSSFRSPYTLLQRGCMHPTGRAVYFAGSNGYAYRMDVGEFANNPPVVNIAEPRTGSTFATGAPVYLSGNGTYDVEDDPLTFTWVSNISGFLAQGLVVPVVFEDLGWHRISLYVDDGKGHNVTDFVIIRLVEPNYPPVPVINSPLEGEVYTNEDTIVFDGNGSYDPNGDPITYHWVSSLSGDVGYEEHVEGLLRVGEHQIFLRVTDDEGLRSDTSVNITVVQANRPPIVYITSPLEGQRFEPDEEVELNASYSFDPDGDDLAFEWESSAEGFLGTDEVLLVVLSEGPHTITLTVSDGRGYTVSATVNVTVEPPEDRAPVVKLVSPASNTTVSGLVPVSGTAIDPEGFPVEVRYAISMPQDWTPATQEANAWIFDWDTTALTNGQYSVFVEASDGTHTTRIFAQYFVDNAPPENQPPTVDLDSPSPGRVRGTVSLKGLASDPDGDPISKVEVRFNAGLWQLATGGAIWTYTWDTKDLPDGPVTVTVRAYDGEDYSEYESYEFTVDNGGSEPDDGTGWALWALVGAVLAVIVLALVLLMRKR